MNVRFAVVAAVDSVVLVVARPNVAHLRSAARTPSAWIAAHGTDAAAWTVTTALLWTLAAWLAVGLVAAALACVPGWAGRAAKVIAYCVLPRAALRFVGGAAGLGVVLSPAAALADAGHVPAPLPPASSASPVLAPPSWPVSQSPSHPHAAPRRNGPVVVVKPGDSLWSISAAHLPDGARPDQIAASWPRWYRANLATIGPDPDVLHVGDRLQVPVTDSVDDAR